MSPQWENFINDLGDRIYLLRQRWERRREAARSGLSREQLIARFRAAMPRDWSTARTFARRNAWVLVAAALATAAFTGGLNAARKTLAAAPRPTVQPVNLFFYDLNTGVVFGAPAALPPIPSPSDSSNPINPMGVRAYFYSCGDCADAAQRTFAFIETYDKTLLAGATPQDAATLAGRADLERARLIAKPAQSPAWLASGSTEASTLLKESRPKCGEGKQPRLCISSIQGEEGKRP